MDKLIIRQLEVSAIIGDVPVERETPQPLWLDLEFAVDIDKVANSDVLTDTVNYVSVHDAMVKFVKASCFQMIEALAAKLADHLLQQFKFSWMRLTIHKRPFDLTDIDGISMVVERGCEQA